MIASADLEAAVSSASSGLFWSTCLISTIIAGALLWNAARAFARRRIIEDTPTALVRSAAQGYTELRGMAALMAGDPIVAPASLRPCVWYRYRIEHLDRDHSDPRRGAEWVTIEDGTSDHLFYLTDTSGSCVVDPDGARVRAARRDHWYGNTRVPGCFSARDATWFARLSARLTVRYRYMEELIEPGAAIYILGNLVTHSGTGPASSDHNAAVSDRLRDWKRDRSGLLRRFDLNRDGEIDATEWNQARDAAASEVIAEQAQDRGAPPADVIGRGRGRDHRQPFIIAATTEDRLITEQTWAACLWLAAAVPLASVTVWAMILRLT